MKTKFIFSCLLILTIFIGINLSHYQTVLAQSSTEFRAEISSLRTRISRLENEVRRLSQITSRSTPQPSRNLTEKTPLSSNFGNPPIINGQPVGRSDPMFKRLATLLIELKEDVKNLDKRLTKVEQQL
jgi:hypothetical protein